MINQRQSTYPSREPCADKPSHLFSAYALLKFAVFFGLSYSRRRAMLDRAYGAKASATKVSDIGLLIVVIFLSLLLYMRGIEHVSFVTGLLVGMTLIQLYFHKFSLPLSESETPPTPTSPIKMMSYAIQARPARPWKELLMIAVLLVLSMYGILSGHAGGFPLTSRQWLERGTHRRECPGLHIFSFDRRDGPSFAARTRRPVERHLIDQIEAGDALS